MLGRRPVAVGSARPGNFEKVSFVHFHCAFCGFCPHPKTRMFVALLGPCFKTGRLAPFLSSSLCNPFFCEYASFVHCLGLCAQKANTAHQTDTPVQTQTNRIIPNDGAVQRSSVSFMAQHRGHFPKKKLPRHLVPQIFKTAADLLPVAVHPLLFLKNKEKAEATGNVQYNDAKRFPFSNFTCFLTLSSECFSSFPHGTCSLSVSRLYLALDGIYHPLWIAFPNNPTLGRVAHLHSMPC